VRTSLLMGWECAQHISYRYIFCITFLDGFCCFHYISFVRRI